MPAIDANPHSLTVNAPEPIMVNVDLIVNDNLDAGDSLALRLSLEGHQTCIARDGQSSLKAVQEFAPHVVASPNIGIPGKNGYELAQRIRSVAGRERTMLVALTGGGSGRQQGSTLTSLDQPIEQTLTRY